MPYPNMLIVRDAREIPRDARRRGVAYLYVATERRDLARRMRAALRG